MTCKKQNCSNECFKNEAFCALHTEKFDYEIDRKKGILGVFRNQLIEYILQVSLGKQLDETEIEDFQNGNSVQSLREKEITIAGVSFPHCKEDQDEGTYEYISILKQFKGIWFYHCSFILSSLFDDCCFCRFGSCFSHTRNGFQLSG